MRWKSRNVSIKPDPFTGEIMLHHFIACCLCLVLGNCVACQHNPYNTKCLPLNMQVVYQSAECGTIKDLPNQVWISDQGSLESVFARILSNRIGKQLPEFTEHFDFDRFGLLFLHMDEKPTGGFSFELLPDHSCLSGNTAVIGIDYIKPDPDAVVSQMITHPCIMIKLEKKDFNRIVILDQNNTPRGTLELNMSSYKLQNNRDSAGKGL